MLFEKPINSAAKKLHNPLASGGDDDEKNHC